MTAGRGGRRERPAVKHPYRDSAILYAVMAVVVVVVGALTGGDLQKAVVIAIIFFVVATGWTWFRFRRREAREQP